MNFVYSICFNNFSFSFSKTLIVQDKTNPNYAIRVKMTNPPMMLRKIVNHPYLIQYPLEDGSEYARIDEDLVKASGKLQVLDAMLTKLKERGHKVPPFFPLVFMGSFMYNSKKS